MSRSKNEPDTEKQILRLLKKSGPLSAGSIINRLAGKNKERREVIQHAVRSLLEGDAIEHCLDFGKLQIAE